MNSKLSLFDIRTFLESCLLSVTNLSEDIRINNICTDTRSLVSGDLFLALRGESFDGHSFIPQALTAGAIAVVTDRPVEGLGETVAQFLVEDTLVAYQHIAAGWRQRFTIPIIGVTGSVGKTTTKELIAAVLSQFGNVHKTRANYNNEIGVPKTLLELSPDHDFAIVEMAMRGRGQIALLADIAKPTIGLITNVGTAHIGLLGSELAIAEAKCELLAHQPPESTAILNRDNALLMETAQRFWQGKTITYGLEGGDVHGTVDGENLILDGVSLPLPLAGVHNASNYLAAIAVAQCLGLDWQQLQSGLTVELPKGRARRYQWGQDVVLLDETYNAGLESMLASLDLLANTPGKRRLAVLGAMKELGDYGPTFHQRVGAKVKALGLDGLFLLANDPNTDAIAAGANGVETQSFSDGPSLVAALKTTLQPGDRLLFKASNSVGLGAVVSQLLAENPTSV
ncbi:UDP-N-acetylmuramoylalanyl-D-glutamyl-2,6-diamino-pimelate-D-alanyl-D-alanine ligase [Synechocystis sp. PCC 6803]|uniref:UDP-N-acetylmuramoyl-tripeptide--D-alanyl-D- alanine ligase n=1 Tax=unclassified Synechocystis TaxID=2640012 RepID=UPI0000164C62|nr:MULTISPECIES: UDP-N-acetylmuramoyl-tripeptide--D-alanyl-D-alanine ligase [unclassified Synechocystis]BAM51922.1 UDP-N-acetylmuramoylalanyl-D-glutamyl-2,6-diamino-pimelate-D-alanyl-D-alanine ligase [Synechocystis sp. PCC 6803] [Bacillus subtilis BEST7613]AGF51859.1 UDP-N-acetylmuramoylalanyl-D-glutamyl-2,6- diamino-pimelate-D-alanyl-D-alanine ligase [Synechocystis sp. PCC 6803]ALJ67835.1 UDP-N-acetylmuramoyl-tripeptide--D-alanyl-D-alanine ligase [Synechocystis sp. PCC 6803]AVP89662.1 UDP-N-ac